MQSLRNLGLAFVLLGSVELAWVTFCLVGGAILGLGAFLDQEAVLLVGTGAYVILALACLPIGLLHVITGARLRRGRGMYLTIASIAGCTISLVLALYCSPLTFAVLIYAVVVLLDPEAREILDAD